MSGDPGAKSLGELQKSWVKLLDDVGPKEYKVARAQYGGDKDVLDALDYGRDLVGKNIRPEEVRKFMSELGSDAERDALRNGVFESYCSHTDDNNQSRLCARNRPQPAENGKARGYIAFR
jgi:hypothetical protein